jgi:hypothetical protein
MHNSTRPFGDGVGHWMLSPDPRNIQYIGPVLGAVHNDDTVVKNTKMMTLCAIDHGVHIISRAARHPDSTLERS